MSSGGIYRGPGGVELHGDGREVYRPPIEVSPKPCSCGSNNLKSKWNSETRVGWVHCDDCGRVSPPVNLSAGRDAIIAKWNEMD